MTLANMRANGVRTLAGVSVAAADKALSRN
jgi:hypothetical protein